MKIKQCIHRNKCSLKKSGLWPLGIWFYKYDVGFHWRTIADGHLYLQHSLYQRNHWWLP